jgi:hypothetical protein
MSASETSKEDPKSAGASRAKAASFDIGHAAHCEADAIACSSGQRIPVAPAASSPTQQAEFQQLSYQG